MLVPVVVHVAVATVVYPSAPTDCALTRVAGLAIKVARPKARKTAPSCMVKTRSKDRDGGIECQEEEYCWVCCKYEQ